MNGSYLLITPVFVPLAGAVLAVLPRARWGAWIVVITSLLTLAASVAIIALIMDEGPRSYRIGGWAPQHGIVLVADHFSALLAATTALVAVAAALYTLTSGKDLVNRRLYHPLFLFLLAALGGVFLTGDLFNLYVFMEMVILSSFGLVAMANRPISAETTFKYAVLSAIGSLLLLVSIGFVYAAVGTLNIADIAQRVRQGSSAPFMPFVAAMMLFAFLLKGAIFPFHFWQPDAHSVAPSPVSAMLSGILVKVGFYGIARMTTLLFPEAGVFLVLAPLGAASALFGGLAALANSNLKRMLAYSTIANMGFILLALGWGGSLGLLAATVTAINHALIKASLFLAGGDVTERLGEQDMARLGGMAQLTPLGAIAFGLGVVGLAGLPPLSGFLSKLTLVQAGASVGDSLLLAVAVVASAMGIVYSARSFVRVYWGETPPEVVAQWKEHAGSSWGLLAPLFLALFYILLGVWPEPLMALAVAAVADLQRPDLYIDVVLGG